MEVKRPQSGTQLRLMEVKWASIRDIIHINGSEGPSLRDIIKINGSDEVSIRYIIKINGSE